MFERLRKRAATTSPALRPGPSPIPSVPRRTVSARREYAAAASGRLVSDWISSATSQNAILRNDLATLRNRARALARDNDYARGFLRQVKDNVAGPGGIALQARPRRPDGSIDRPDAELLERTWRRWCRRGVCTVDRRLSLRDAQRLWIESLVRDGEVIVRLVENWAGNEFKFALQFLEADYLDHTLNVPATAARGRIVMGVEVDDWGAPIAYHLLRDHPGDTAPTMSTRRHERVPAEQILHGFIPERIGQARGATWFAAPARRLHMLGAYEETELVAARVASSKMGFFTQGAPEDFTAGAEDAEGRQQYEVEPGLIDTLPPGVGFEPWDPQHPVTSFDTFVKALLRGIATGLGVSYNSLAADLEGVNYSSLRQGALAERDVWQALQTFQIEHLMAPVYERWLVWAITTRALPVPAARLEKFSAVDWQPRGWQWVDPLKEVQAHREAVDLRIASRTEIAASRGRSIDDIFAEHAAEQEQAAAAGVSLPGKAAAASTGEANDNDDESDER